MTNSRLLYAWGFILLFCLGSCEKKVVEGPAGPAGADGKNATVTTTTLNVGTNAWGMDADSIVWSAVVFTPLITKDVVSKGVVKLSVLRGNTWKELPLTDGGDVLTQFGYEQGQLQLEVVELHGRAPRPADQQFKMMIIPEQ